MLFRSWAGVYPREIQELQERARRKNWDLSLGEDGDTQSEEALRRAGARLTACHSAATPLPSTPAATHA